MPAPFGSPITLCHIRGIRFSADWMWFALLFVLIVSLSRSYGNILVEGSSSSASFVLALVGVVGFFGLIVLHELAHALAAARHGIRTSSVELWFLWGATQTDREPDAPSTELKVAAAGPLGTLLASLLITGIGFLVAGPDGFRAAVTAEAGAEISVAMAMVATLVTINGFVLAFNLMPVFPLDGGRMLRAVAWRLTGSRTSATRFMAVLNRAWVYLCFAAGLFLLINGDLFSAALLAAIGVLILKSTQDASFDLAEAPGVERIAVADVMDDQPVAILGELDVERALDEYFLRYRWPWFPVVDSTHRFLGVTTRDRIDEVPEGARSATLVADLLEDDRDEVQIREEASLGSMLQDRRFERYGALMVVDAEARLHGVIGYEHIDRALRDAEATAGAEKGRH